MTPTEQIRVDRARLEEEIEALLNNFTQDTGIDVVGVGVNIRSIPTNGNKAYTVKVILEDL